MKNSHSLSPSRNHRRRRTSNKTLWMHKYGVYINVVFCLLLSNGKGLAGFPGDGPGFPRHTPGSSRAQSLPHIAASNIANGNIANTNIANNYSIRNGPLEDPVFTNSNLLSHLKGPSKPSRSSTGIRYKQPSFYNSATGKFSRRFQDTVFVTLDINKTQRPFGYEVTVKGDKRIFRANPHFVFGLVKSGATVLWQPTQAEYPNKVIYKVVNGENRVKVYFPAPQPTVSRLQVIRPTRPKPDPPEPAASAEPIYGSPKSKTVAKSGAFPIPTTHDPYWYYRRIETLVPPLTKPKKPEPPKPRTPPTHYHDFLLEHEPDQPPFWQVEYVTLDVQRKAGSSKFHFFEDFKTHTGIYFVKQGFLFRKIKFTQPVYVCLLDLLNVWSASGHCPYAKMVMVNGLDEAEPHITVYFTDGSQRFNFMEYIYKWLDQPKPFESAVELNQRDLPDVRIFTRSESGVSMNDTSQFSASMYTVSNAQTIKFPNLLSYVFRFTQSSCIKIVILGALVWAHSDEGPFPTSMYFFASLDLVIVEFTYYMYYIYKRHGDEWFLIDYT